MNVWAICGRSAHPFLGVHYPVKKKTRFMEISMLPPVCPSFSISEIFMKFGREFPYKSLSVKRDFGENSTHGHSYVTSGRKWICTHSAHIYWPILVKFDFCVLLLSSCGLYEIGSVKHILYLRLWMKFCPSKFSFQFGWHSVQKVSTGVRCVLTGYVKIGSVKFYFTWSVNEFTSAFLTFFVRHEWNSVWQTCI
jgi:hypothetical protein